MKSKTFIFLENELFDKVRTLGDVGKLNVFSLIFVLNFSCCSIAQSCPTVCDPMDCSTPGSLSFIISQSLLKLMSVESVMPSNHLILYHPTFSSCLQSFPASGSFPMSWHQVAKVLEFQLQPLSFK